jgi:hypothetical protein
MAITITLTGTNPPDVLEVGLTEERGQVLLEVLLDPDELTGSRDLEAAPFERAELLGIVGQPEEDATEADLLNWRITNLNAILDDAVAERDHHRAEAVRLAKRLAQVRDERAVTRWLEPAEARELAAVLWHYAGETERPR